MTQHKDEDRREIEERIAEADRIATEGIGRPQRGDRLQVIIHEGDNEAEAMEKALAEHVALYPGDAGRKVEDFKWIISEVISELLTPRHLAVGPKSSVN